MPPDRVRLVDQDLQRRLELVEVELLRHHAEQRQRALAVALHAVPEHLDPAGAGVDQGGGDADQGRLARAVRPQQGEEIAFGDLELDALQRRDPVGIRLLQVADGEGGYGHGRGRLRAGGAAGDDAPATRGA